jgi:hypothetical protein
MLLSTRLDVAPLPESQLNALTHIKIRHPPGAAF